VRFVALTHPSGDGSPTHHWRVLLDRSGFGDYFSFVEQFAFAYVCAMANVHFTGRTVLAQRDFLSFVMRSSLCAALLGMSSFRIWHLSSIFK
jgi:hypothetical protein